MHMYANDTAIHAPCFILTDIKLKLQDDLSVKYL